MKRYKTLDGTDFAATDTALSVSRQALYKILTFQDKAFNLQY